jgi:hypothetical protein
MKEFGTAIGFLVIIAFLGALVILEDRSCRDCWTFQRHRHRGVRTSSTSLKTLSSAQADFRANDRDHDGVNQFWRGDVSGLYTTVAADGTAIKLIELSVAAADDRPKTDILKYAPRTAKAGYWYRAIRYLDEDPKAPDPNRFAYCAFPDSPSAGKYMFIVNENNTIFRAAANNSRGIEFFPTDEELKTSWSKVD